MRILHTTKALWTGGIETMVCNLANQMSLTEDVSVCVFWKTDKQDAEKRLSSNVKFFDMGFCGNGKPFKEILRLCKIIRNGDYDIVNIHGFFYLYMFSIFFLHRKTKFVYTLHSDAYHEGTDWDNKLIRAKQYFFKKKWMYPVCISTYAQKTFNELYGCDSILIHNGISLNNGDVASGQAIINPYKITENTKVFLHPGRISRAKNQIVLCEVFDRLIKNGYDVILLIAGGKQDPNVYKSISKYFSDRIIFLGERRDIPNLLSVADGMCLPSIFEGFGLVVVEALAASCIPVCTPVGGITDIITDRDNGILSKSTSADDYYDALVTFLKMSDDDVRSMKAKGRLSYSKFDIATTSDQYLNHYDYLLNKGGSI